MGGATLSAGAILAVWERGIDLSSPRRALALLAAAHPDVTPEELLGWSVGRRDRALLRLRAAMFGRDADCIARCPSCGELAELGLDVAAMAGEDGPEASAPPLEAEGYRVACRLPDSRDLLAAEAAGSLERARAILARRLLVSVEGSEGVAMPPELLPAAVSDAAFAAIDSADPRAWRELLLECPACSAAWTAPFDASAFVWAELEALATRLLDEVHQLAAAYGWSEHDILAMGPRRRAAYLERLGA
jgi:hypothetical protein